VTLYLDLGFNDQGEVIPFQGGTNEEVVHRMYTALNSEGNGAEKRLGVFWYTGKDQTRPLNAAMKKRNCHGTFSRPRRRARARAPRWAGRQADGGSPWGNRSQVHGGGRSDRHSRQRKPGYAHFKSFASGKCWC